MRESIEVLKAMRNLIENNEFQYKNKYSKQYKIVLDLINQLRQGKDLTVKQKILANNIWQQLKPLVIKEIVSSKVLYYEKCNYTYNTIVDNYQGLLKIFTVQDTISIYKSIMEKLKANNENKYNQFIEEYGKAVIYKKLPTKGGDNK